MTSDLPLVTIVTPAFNCAPYIVGAYTSIRAQTEVDWEWIVVDDASIDGTPKILADIAAKDPRVIVVTCSQNGGAGLARNVAIRQARGRFIAFLDADDFWHPEKLAKQSRMMLQTGTGLTYTAYDIVNGDGVFQGHATVPGSITYPALLKRNVIGCLTAMYDTQVYGKAEMPQARKRQDYGLWLRLLRSGDTARAIPGTWATYRRLQGSLSSNKMQAAIGTWYVFRQMEQFGLAKSTYYFTHYVAGTLLRRSAQRLQKP